MAMSPQAQEGIPVTPSSLHRRATLGVLAVTALGAPLAIAGSASAAPNPAALPKAAPHAAAAPELRWSPTPATDGLKAFEGIEADRGNHHPDRKYIYVEGDHYRFDIYKDDRDTTGGGDRQRTESKGMVTGGTAQKMRDGETWTISYEMYMPASLHGTSKFSHIFQLKTPATNGGPWVTLDPTRSGSTERLRARAYSTSGTPDIAATDLAPLRDKWITIEWTFTIGSKGKARFVLRNGTGSDAPVVVDHSLSNVNVPAQGDYVRPKWGIYRSVESASSDIINTYLLIRNYRAYH